ncbi:carboxypeptidase-like regulatory domain-containing protein [Dyadobacter subterraneus]|uniref:TonB-dependent receptor n=1 Tax=Dyadobacter subterraneus TaxID=2773304 RepID=A0ABR9WEC8_9BACT|nr:TonB-dependent receptor [Dyadobacter subterraneus]MBE9463850.1 TonB-dependent receptor [Dyadobacter subterraneus]
MSKYFISFSPGAYCGIFLLVLAAAATATAQNKFTISGTMKDKSNGETLIGASIYVKQSPSSGAVTNAYGFYSITLPQGSYTIEYSYIGYDKIVKELVLTSNLTANIELPVSSRVLDEVKIVDESRISTSRNFEMSVNKLDIKTIQKLPALMGEVDIVKSLQFLPGVSQVGEGSSGFNVRGGSVGQNLVLLDEAPVYNSSHMLGFFSVFNPDAVKDVKLYKGAIPSEYGGRISSVLDVRLKEGNSKKTEVDGGVGFIFSRLAVQGPLVKDKSSYLIAVRRSYIDGLSTLLTSNNFGLNFYDITLKTNYTLNQKNRLYLSGFFGRDNFGLSDDAKFNWGNKSGTLRWNTVLNSKLFANVSAVFSNYNYNLGFNQDENNKYSWSSAISNYVLKPDFSYFINSNSELKFGLESSYYQFNPSKTVGTTNGETVDSSQPKKYALEMAGYVSHHLKVGSKLEVQYGVRFSYFNYLGPGTAYTYNDTIAGRKRTAVAQRQYKNGQSIASYNNPEPRLSFKYQINDQASIKASFSHTAQYVHFISNTSASNPLNIWTPSTNNIKPAVGNQYTLGYFTDLGQRAEYEFSAETFYRNTTNEIDYINGAELLNNDRLEGDLLSGNGRAYGLELYLQKKKGLITGWVSYTLSRSELKVDGINNGKWYPTRFDQTHNLKVVASYTINPKWSTTADFAFTTGTPTTYPNQRYLSQGILIPYNTTNARNDARLTPYHRLDLSLRMEGKTLNKKGLARKNHDFWFFSIYNVYGRKNAFSTYFSQSTDRVTSYQPIQTQAHRVSIIGSMVPSVSYNFKF